ncbi:MAG: threonine-phosphate decarboxylase [Candidatus Omnitrophica bacterium]|nr:threonine-phosphate decarboxylase [Candidatus Omnitrophota bacterium]
MPGDLMGTHGGNLWPLLKEGTFGLDEILDFSADLNPLGPPPDLGVLIQEAQGQIAWYPEPTYEEFREAAGRLHRADPAAILPGNGTADLIHLISRWRAGEDAAVAAPTFTEYERAVLANGGRITPLDRARLLFLCNPNNPTGTVQPREELLKVAEACERRGAFLVVDEAYMDLVEDPLRYSMIRDLARFSRLIVLRSMTKSFAIPGLRVGYLAASPGIVAGLRDLQPPWPMNGLAASVGARLLERGEPFLAQTRQALKRFRDSLREDLAGLGGIRPSPSSANFFLCRLEDPGWSNRRLADQLKERGILIRSCDDFTGLEPGRFIRVAVRRREENERLVGALREILRDAG